MAQKLFTKEDFVKNDEKQYQIEYNVQEIGEGSNLTVEKKNENGEYEVVQTEINRYDDRIFIVWSEPFDGRLIFEK